MSISPYKTVAISTQRGQIKSANLASGGEVGGIRPRVVGHRVGQVVAQVLQRALSGNNGLHEEPEHREHRQTPILDLLHLQLRESVGVVCQPQRVEAASRVDGVRHIAQRSSRHAVPLHGAHQDHLARPDGQNALRVNQAGIAQVVQPSRGENLGSGLKPHGLAELYAVLRQKLGGHDSQGAEHGPARVNDLELAVAGEGLGVGGESSSVPAIVARELTGQVRWGVLGEGAQEFGAVSTVPESHNFKTASVSLQVNSKKTTTASTYNNSSHNVNTNEHRRRY